MVVSCSTFVANRKVTMARILFSTYQKEDLLELVGRLDRDYYEVIDELCRHAAVHASEVEISKINQSTILFLDLCKKLIGEISLQVKMRREVFIPYAHQLLKKASQKHSCKTCDENCQNLKFVQLKLIIESHETIKELLFRIQQLAKPLYLETIQSISYKILRNEMMIIDTALSELFYIEEVILIPKVKEVQNQLNDNS
jgi:hypothetical protein